MKPRPLIKWKSFWLGILVLGFLGFGWVRSMSRHDVAGWLFSSLTEAVWFRSLEGSVVIDKIGPVRISPVSPRFQVYSLQLGPTSQWIPEAARYAAPESFPSKAVHVAYWLLILAFFLPWSAFLAWRWRRQRILTKAHPLS